MLNCAILDDYQNCAFEFADWGSLDGVQVKNFSDTITRVDALADRLAGCEIIVAMRERTRFDAALQARLPRLKLLVTAGLRNQAIDLAAADAHGITVCGTQGLPSPTPELVWGILLALARNIPGEAASVRGGGWQRQIGVGLEGKTLGIVGLGENRHARGSRRPGFPDGRVGLAAHDHRRTLQSRRSGMRRRPG